MNRRELLAGAMVTAASVARIKGANDQLRLGLIGCGSRGTYVGDFMRQAPNTEFVAFCDVYQTNAEKARAKLNPAGTTFKDMRQLLDRKDVDAVLIATPDHWHAPATVAACAAGKDVYVEKPLAHSVREGRAMVKAARDHDRIVQAGTQQRSAPHFAACARIVQSGELGEVHLVRVWNYMSFYPRGFGRPADGEPPAGLDWDMYLGPAPVRPFNPMRFLSTYRWFWDYSGGLITDFGTHRFDTVHEIMGEERPVTVAATGRRYAMRDLGEMPDTLQVTYEYPSFVMSYECSTLNSFGMGDARRVKSIITPVPRTTVRMEWPSTVQMERCSRTGSATRSIRSRLTRRRKERQLLPLIAWNVKWWQLRTRYRFTPKNS